MKTIGIDIGTTTISMVVMDAERRELLSAKTIPNGSSLETGKEWERLQSPRMIVKRTMTVLEEIIGNYPDFAAIGLTGQMHGILYLDEQGYIIDPLYTWQDQRASLPVFDGKSMTQVIEQECGLKVPAGYGLATHLYNQRMGLLPAEAKCLCTITDYLAMKLTGRKRPVLHASNAASLGFYDVTQSSFDRKAFRAMGGDVRFLPRVTNQVVTLGSFRGIPVTVAIGDNQASFWGAVGGEPGAVLVNMGTGGQISMLSNVYYEAPGIEARPFNEDNFLLSGSSLCGGNAYAILERFFRIYAAAAGAPKGPQYDVMGSLLASLEGESDLEVQTTFSGTRLDPNEKGHILGITDRNFTPAHLIRGVLEGMAQELYDMYQVIEAGTGCKAEHLIGSGNALRKNPILQEIFAKKFGCPLDMSAWQEEAACGAAISAVDRIDLEE